MDPFSVGIAAVGITGTAVTGISALRQTIDSIKNAHEDVAQIRVELDNIRQPLDALRALVTDADEETSAMSKQALSKTGMADAVNDCGKACEAFNKRLQKWTKHSSDENLSLRDKMSIGVWNKERVRTFKTRVETCQRTVHFAISSTQLILQEKCARNAASYELIRQNMQTLELQTQETLALVKQQREEASQRRVMLSQDTEADDDGDDEADGQRALAIKKVDEQFRLHDDTQVSLGVIFAQIRAGRTHQEIGNVVTDQESMALVGLPERLVGKMDQRIGNVSTTNKSAALVGVFDQGVDIKDFFKRA